VRCSSRASIGDRPGLWLAELASFFGQLQDRALPLVEAPGVRPVNTVAGNPIEGCHGATRTTAACRPFGVDDGHSGVGLAWGFVGPGEGAGEAGEAPVPVQAWSVLVAAGRLAMALMRADERDGSGGLLRVLARRATAGRQGRAGADAGPRRSAAEPP
jgi:hypothetical protein